MTTPVTVTPPVTPPPARPRWRAVVAAVRRDWLLTLLVAAHVALKLALLPTAVASGRRGDEHTYNDGGAALANALRAVVAGRGLPTGVLAEHVVGNGWFMPGMSLVLTPLYLVSPTPGLATVRVYLGVVSLVAFLGVVAAVRRVLGRRYAAAVLVIPGLVPMWVLFSYTAWGDLGGGLAALGVITFLVHLWHRLDAARGVGPREGALLGLLLCVTLYLRSSALPLVAGLLVLALLAVLCRTRGAARRRSAVAWVMACATFAVLLLPWSYAASRALGGRVVTTTTLPISIGYAFGHRDQLCFGPCRPGSIWFETARYSDEVHRETGVGRLVVQRQMADYALRDVTVASYVRAVRDDFDRYVLMPADYERAFRPRPVALGDGVARFVHDGTRLLYLGGLALAALSVLWARRRARSHQVVALLVSVVGASFMVQPFVHVCSGRYWPVFAPLLGLAVAGLTVRAEPDRSGRWLWRLQAAGAVVWAAVAAAVMLLGR